MQLAEGGYSFVFLVEEVQAGLPVEGAEFALKRVNFRPLQLINAPRLSGCLKHCELEITGQSWQKQADS